MALFEHFAIIASFTAGSNGVSLSILMVDLGVPWWVVDDPSPGYSRTGFIPCSIFKHRRQMVELRVGLLVVTTLLGLLLLGSHGAAQGVTVITGTVTHRRRPGPSVDGCAGRARGRNGCWDRHHRALWPLSAGQYRIDVQVSPALDGQQVTFSVHGATVSPAVTAILRRNRVIRVDIAASTRAPVATATGTATAQPTATPQPILTPETDGRAAAHGNATARLSHRNRRLRRGPLRPRALRLPPYRRPLRQR